MAEDQFRCRFRGTGEECGNGNGDSILVHIGPLLSEEERDWPYACPKHAEQHGYMCSSPRHRHGPGNKKVLVRTPDGRLMCPEEAQE